jgi:hypothetical protein
MPGTNNICWRRAGLHHIFEIGLSSFLVSDNYDVYWVVCRSEEGHAEIGVHLFDEWNKFELVGIKMN